MATLSLISGNCGRGRGEDNGCGFGLTSHFANEFLASDTHGRLLRNLNGIRFKEVGKFSVLSQELGKGRNVQRMADDTGLDFTYQINALELKYQQALKDLYTHLTPIQCLNIARHPNRPTVLDRNLNITEKWVELHLDRAGYDDPAIVTGIGSIEGEAICS